MRPGTSRPASRCSRPCSSRRRPGLAVLPRETRMLAACASVVPLAALVVARSSGLARDAAPDLPAPVRRARGRRRDRAARPRLGHAPRSPRSWSRSSPGHGTGPRAVRVGAGRSARRPAPTRPRTSPRRSRPTTSCSATTRSTCRPGSCNATSRSSSLPRADADLALHNLLDARAAARPRRLGPRREQDDELDRSLQIPLRSPRPASAFEVRAFGPFLVIRTREPVVTPERYLCGRGRRCSSASGSSSATPTSTCRRSSARRGHYAATAPSRSLSTSSR